MKSKGNVEGRLPRSPRRQRVMKARHKNFDDYIVKYRLGPRAFDGEIMVTVIPKSGEVSVMSQRRFEELFEVI